MLTAYQKDLSLGFKYVLRRNTGQVRSLQLLLSLSVELMRFSVKFYFSYLVTTLQGHETFC